MTKDNKKIPVTILLRVVALFLADYRHFRPFLRVVVQSLAYYAHYVHKQPDI